MLVVGWAIPFKSLEHGLVYRAGLIARSDHFWLVKFSLWNPTRRSGRCFVIHFRRAPNLGSRHNRYDRYDIAGKPLGQL